MNPNQTSERKLADRDQAVVWHPFTQMLGAEVLPVKRGRGAWLELEDGCELLDGIASWWVCLHGHAHPVLARAVANQAYLLEQVIFAGFTHEPAVALAEKLIALTPEKLQRVFFSDNGSTSVEVALKLALQYFHNRGEKRVRILALDDAYHGDTFGAMSVSGASVFTEAFQDLFFEVEFLPSPALEDVSVVEAALDNALAQGPPAALILEPLVQGVAGMQMYAPEVLEKLIGKVQAAGGLVIADEIMTGFYRTGSRFAFLQQQHTPDLLCLSKALTGGFLPLGTTLCSQEIYDAFLSQDKTKTFFHGHSFTANPLACAVANASLNLLESPEVQQQIAQIAAQHQAACKRFERLPQVHAVRTKGIILAVELSAGESGYLSQISPQLYPFFLQQGVLLRPLGNVVYILPPLCITPTELEMLYSALEKGVEWLGEQG